MAPANASAGSTTSVQVAVRIRPVTNQDATNIPPRFQRIVIHDSSTTQVAVDATSGPPAQGGSQPVTGPPPKKQTFNFDQVHGQSTTQHSLYTSTAQPLVSRFLEGFNCTVLAYGQTSSGKTYSMTGVDLDADPRDATNGMGIIPRAVAAIFAKANELKTERAGGWQYAIKGSFIELYNEDLIDLLVDESSGVRREVQIREDKDGHIIWGGLREVNVRNAQEVMNLIRQGTAIRRTNETDMNAQSSRSHAIFSLTLTQKKYTGSGAPPRSTSPLPPAAGRSPSRLARPSSVYASGGPSTRVGSPTVGRPPTPSFANAMSRGGLRPSSALGHRSGSPEEEDGPGSWTTIVSKFHFVDLAGSERLKRTAAQGDRVKEGISINSGLLALGNVISALGDPSKSRATTHVPYRDSKLTRLLQDSLGGNAHTLMIACVSPAEWNVAETINTLKYANRARNIKNRAEIREKEEGWDDVEWLQSMVLKLRKEVKVMKDGGVLPPSASGAGTGDVASGPSARVLEQMVELQSNYEDLRSKFTERTEELTRLRREMEDRRYAGGAVGASRKYEEIVGPVIDEYEKTISAMEAELSLNRAALRHTNDMFIEKEEELESLAIRHAATEAYVDELRLRVAKLSERESATESYIRDLENKLKAIDDTTQSSNSTVSDLKREIAAFKDAEAHSAQHIADLEARLSKADENVLALRATIQALEIQSESRRAQAEELERQMLTLTKDGESWRAELEQREHRVTELEERLKRWEEERDAAQEDRARLGGLVGQVSKARQSLDEEVARAQANDKEPAAATAAAAAASTEGVNEELQKQYVALQETHTATLADLSSIAEAKLQSAQRDGAVTPSADESTGPPQYDSMSLGRRRGMAKRANLEMFENSGVNINGGGSGNGTPGTQGRRLFFRQAASSESLHARSQSQSQPLSQELSSARTPKHSLTSLSINGVGAFGSHSPISAGTTTPKMTLLGSSAPSLSSAPQTPSEGNNARSVQSLEKEIMRLQEVLKEREAEIGALEISLKELKNPPKKARVAEEDLPEDVEDEQPSDGKLSPSLMKRFARLRHSLIIEHPPKFPDDDAPPESESLDRLDELMRSMAQKESQHKEQVDSLSSQLARMTRQYEDLSVLSRDQAMNMSNELEGLRSQLQNAETQRVELQSQLVELQKREAELVDAHSVTSADHSKAIDALKAEHAAAIASHSDEAAARIAQAVQELTTAKANHEAALVAKQNEVDALVQRISADHESTLSRLHKEIAEAEARALKMQEEKETACRELKSEHAAALKARSDEVEAQLAKTREEHQQAVANHERLVADKEREFAASLQALKTEHEGHVSRLRSEHQKSQADAIDVLRSQHSEKLSVIQAEHEAESTRKQEASALAIKQAQERHEEEMQKLKASHDEALARKEADLTSQLARLKEDHAAALKQAEIAREGSLSESQDAQLKAVQQLQEQHAEDIRRREQAFTQDLENAKVESARLLSEKERDHDAAIAKLKASYEEQAKAAEEAFGQQLADAVKRVGDQHLRLVEKADGEFLQKMNELSAEHAQKLATKEAEHNELLAKQRSEHAAAISELQAIRTKLEAEVQTLEASLARAKEEFDAFRQEQETSLSTLRQEHSTSLANLSAVKEERDRERARLTEALAKSDSALESLKTASKAELASAVANAQQEQATLISSISKEHDTALAQLKAELEEKKAAWDAERMALQKAHTEEILASKTEHQQAMTAAQNEIVALREQHQQEIEEIRLEHDMLVAEEREQQAQALAEVDEMHYMEREALQKDRDLLAAQVEELSAAAAGDSDLNAQLQQMRSEHELALNEKLVVITRLEMEITTVMKERREYSQQIDMLKSELERAQMAQPTSSDSKRESLVEELDRHRSVIGDLRIDLQRTKDAMDTLQAEKARQDQMVKELQAQLVASTEGHGSNDSHDVHMTPRSRVNGVPPSKPPPAGALPSLPNGAHLSHDKFGSISSRSMTTSTMHSATDSLVNPSTPATSILSPGPQTDSKIAAQLEELTRQVEEQDTMIKTLNKQLTHCEGDLQAHMDLVRTLESTLNDSERNLRKARLQASEMARERDTLQHQLEAARNDLQDAKREVVNVRMSIVEEKQSLEQRLDEERRAKERARAQLDSRMEELAKRKSKFACM
ncbi:Kinesin-like protein KIF21A [Serendipita indica DSM 11827]|nr:Kinesin-like protein KIF21A [Serendipita indica DSM 11827]